MVTVPAGAAIATKPRHRANKPLMTHTPYCWLLRSVQIIYRELFTKASNTVMKFDVVYAPLGGSLSVIVVNGLPVYV